MMKFFYLFSLYFCELIIKRPKGFDIKNTIDFTYNQK